jgi:pyruvate/2-oxoacid:ferredoxin oxidoreductase beta subunit
MRGSHGCSLVGAMASCHHGHRETGRQWHNGRARNAMDTEMTRTISWDDEEEQDDCRVLGARVISA